MRKLRFGVLGAAKIAREKVIPPLQRSARCEVVALASRDLARGREAADRLGIARAYGSYEELLADPEIDAVYNPLPNHLHVPWTIKAAEAGKHVLCEKPIGLDAAEAARLIEVRDRTGVRIQEAFMVRTHPQWLRARELVRERADRRAEGDPGPVQLPPDRPRQRAQRRRMGRRRAARHRLLPDHHLALRHRPGARARRGHDRARPRDRHRPAGHGAARLRQRPVLLPVRHPDRAAPDHAVLRHQGPPRGRDRLQRAQRRALPAHALRRRRAWATWRSRRSSSRSATSTGSWATPSPPRSRTARRSRCRWRTASPTCG